jgi:hypothetical protein
MNYDEGKGDEQEEGDSGVEPEVRGAAIGGVAVYAVEEGGR